MIFNLGPATFTLDQFAVSSGNGITRFLPNEDLSEHSLLFAKQEDESNNKFPIIDDSFHLCGKDSNGNQIDAPVWATDQKSINTEDLQLSLTEDKYPYRNCHLVDRNSDLIADESKILRIPQELRNIAVQKVAEFNSSNKEHTKVSSQQIKNSFQTRRKLKKLKERCSSQLENNYIEDFEMLIQERKTPSQEDTLAITWKIRGKALLVKDFLDDMKEIVTGKIVLE